MIKIPKEQHNKMMQTVFSQESLAKIYDWIDPKITGLKNDAEMEKALIRMYLGLADGKLTKIFIYQILVLNGIIGDDVHDKSVCSYKSECPLIKAIKEEYPEIDTMQICWNLNVCLLVPGMQLQPPFKTTEKEELLLDDSVLKKK
jgi:hypothetical protein